VKPAMTPEGAPSPPNRVRHAQEPLPIVGLFLEPVNEAGAGGGRGLTVRLEDMARQEEAGDLEGAQGIVPFRRGRRQVGLEKEGGQAEELLPIGLAGGEGNGPAGLGRNEGEVL